MISDKYVLKVNQELTGGIPEKNRCLLAELRTKDKGLLCIGISYDKNLRNTHLAFTYDMDWYRLAADDRYAELLFTDREAFEALLTHYCGRISLCMPDGDPTGGYDAGERRAAMAARGEVDPLILGADSFAAEHCGKDAVIRMLDYCISVEKESFLSEYTVTELELRKEALSRL